MAAKLPIVRTVADLRNTVQGWRRRGRTIALVPTMGALHDGHISLVRAAKKLASRVVVSIFVNPTQFGPKEDYAAYPRNEQHDWEKLAAAKADLLYAPSVNTMYPEDFSTRVEVIGLTARLEGASRPHHFSGVTTVVTKLFMHCLPDVALFGEKDYQQLLVIQQMARDLDLPIRVLGEPTVREADGLALSSRNAYLSAAERPLAPRLHAVLQEVSRDLSAGRPIHEAIFLGLDWLAGAGLRVDYLELRDAHTLMPLEDTHVTAPARLLAAVFLGKTRLIDNVPVAPLHK